MFLFRAVPLALVGFVLKVSGSVDQSSFAANTGNVTGNHNPLAFDGVFINRGNALDQNTWRVGIHSWGLFLVTLSAGHPGAGAYTDLRLEKDGSLIARICLCAASGARDNTNGLDFVSFFNRLDEIHIGTYSTNLVSTPTGKLTSWGTVSLSHNMEVHVGFGVTRSSSNTVGQITFNQVWANEGNAWDTGNNIFIAPVSGVYFFSFSMGTTVGIAHIHLHVNGSTVLYAYRARNSPYAVETFGRSVMIHLNRNDRVSVYSGTSGYSDSYPVTSFSGFLYSSLRDDQLAWAVYRTSSHTGSADPLVYDHVEVTEGGAWVDNRAFCSKTGLYYVHISTGILYNYPAQLTLMKGSHPQGELQRVATENNLDTISRSMIIQCNAGETLRVVVSSSSGLYSEQSGKFIAFVGFYLFT